MRFEKRDKSTRNWKEWFKGFTLVELIVVITILAILATVGFLSLSGYSDDARSATVKANVRTVYSAILTESTTSGNSPRYYVSHDAGAALSGAFVFVDGKQVALTGGDLGAGDSNYSAGNPRWDRLRMNGDKFRLSSGAAGVSGLPYAFGGFGAAGIAGFAGQAQDANAAYSTGELAVGAVDILKTGTNGRRRATPYFQVAGVVAGSKALAVNGNYVPGAAAGAPSLVRDPSSTNPAAPLVDPSAATVAGDEASGRKWSDGTFAPSCVGYASSPAGKAYVGSTGSGTYWIDPDGAGGNAEFKAYCDMSTDGGGWTLIYSTTSDTGSVTASATVTLRSNKYLDIPKIQALASVSGLVHIRDQASGFVQTKNPDSNPIRNLRAGKTMNAWYDLGFDTTTDWTGTKMGNLPWLWSATPGCYSNMQTAVLPIFYWGCGISGSAHLTSAGIQKGWNDGQSNSMDIMLR